LHIFDSVVGLAIKYIQNSFNNNRYCFRLKLTRWCHSCCRCRSYKTNEKMSIKNITELFPVREMKGNYQYLRQAIANDTTL
jgi:hypothetical protein